MKVIQKGNSGPIFYIGVSSLDTQIDQYILSDHYLLVLFEVENWNDDFSPWKAQNPMGGNFGGNAYNTLEYLTKEIIPIIHQQYPAFQHDYIGGYSLSGLFALWSYLENPVFNGCIVSSASLWFDGFHEYLLTHQPRENTFIYLSLGGKEEKTKNEIVASIGNRYRELSKRYKQCPLQTTLVMNPGGHFTNSSKRVAEGIDWIIQQEMRSFK